MIDATVAPKVDAQGFAPFEALAAMAAAMSPEDFVAACPIPALVLALAGGSRVDPGSTCVEEGDKERSKRPTLVLEGRELEAAAAARVAQRPATTRIAFLRKRAGNPFPQLITLGRTMSNDIVVLVETVSKFQGYFVSTDGRWAFTDQHSTNGTYLNGRLLEKGTRHALADGDRLKLGSRVEVQLLAPGSLYDRLREV